MFGTDNTIKVLIGKDINITATGSADPQSASFIADGEVGILTENTSGEEELYPAGVASDRQYLRIVQRSGDNIHYSPRIKVANIVKTSNVASAAPVEQVDYIGYNTSTGSIEELSNNQYMLHITYRHDDKIWSEQLNKRTYVYYSDTTATQLEIAKDFVQKINLDGYSAVKAEMITNGTFTAASQNCTVYNGSNSIVFAAAPAAPPVQGTLVRIGGTTAAAAVYVVTAVISATVYELNTPYQGTSGTVLAANIGIMTAITAYGIRLTGESLTYKSKGLIPYNKVKFETAIANFGSTTITNATALVFGHGTGYQVADLEWFALGGDGIRNFMHHPIPEGRTDAVTSAYYKTISIEYYNNDDQYVISGTKPSKALVYVFFAATAGAGADPTNTNYSTFQTNFNTYVPAALHI